MTHRDSFQEQLSMTCSARADTVGVSIETVSYSLNRRFRLLFLLISENLGVNWTTFSYDSSMENV